MKPREASEIRTAIARYRAGVQVCAAFRVAVDAGHKARLSGEPVSVCRLRRPDRRNAWLRGWQAAEVLLSEHEGVRSMTPAERAKARAALDVLREVLPFLRQVRG